MIIKIPQSSKYHRVMIEVTGPNVHRVIEASTDVAEVTPRLPDGVCEDGLTVTAQFLNEAREPMARWSFSRYLKQKGTKKTKSRKLKIIPTTMMMK